MVILEILGGNRYKNWESKDEKEIFKKCDGFKDSAVHKFIKRMLYTDTGQRGSPLNLVELLASDIEIKPKLIETLDYFKKRDRFWNLFEINDIDHDVARTLHFE